MPHAACEYISLLYIEVQLFYPVFAMPHLTEFEWMFYYISNIYLLHKIINQNIKFENI